MVAPPLSGAACAAQLGVSRETLARLTLHLELLQRWQTAINLVGPATLADPWRRHVLDSAQLLAHLPEGAGNLVDLGSGAGFPGLVLAILGVPHVTLIESHRRKAQFLRQVAQATATEVTILAERAEQVAPFAAAVVTARALAPLPRLLPLAARFLAADGVCLLLKGATVGDELTAAAKSWHMAAEKFPSLSAPSGIVLKLRGIARARDRQPQATHARPRDRDRQSKRRGR